jgi:hypothetical protein
MWKIRLRYLSFRPWLASRTKGKASEILRRLHLATYLVPGLILMKNVSLGWTCCSRCPRMLRACNVREFCRACKRTNTVSNAQTSMTLEIMPHKYTPCALFKITQYQWHAVKMKCIVSTNTPSLNAHHYSLITQYIKFRIISLLNLLITLHNFSFQRS